MSLEFIEDDFDVANEFVRKLPAKIRSERFSLDIVTNKPIRWTPTHVVLAVVDGKVVAMADALYADGNKAANGSLVALRGHGALALRAFFHLKNVFPAGFWESCLRDPTPSTMAISRKFFDMTFDQGTWEVHQELMRQLGTDIPLAPAPILASNNHLKLLGLPPISQIPMALKREIISAALSISPSNPPVISGKPMDAQSLIALSFDIIDASYKVRQYVTRLLIVGMGALAGQIGDPAATKRIVKPRFLSKYREGLERFLEQ